MEYADWETYLYLTLAVLFFLPFMLIIAACLIDFLHGGDDERDY